MYIESELSPSLIATTFAQHLLREIGTNYYLCVLRENAIQNRKLPHNGACASHDYCDANMVMDAALASHGSLWSDGHEDDDAAQQEVRHRLWNEAWCLFTDNPAHFLTVR